MSSQSAVSCSVPRSSICASRSLLADQAQEVGDDLGRRRVDLDAAQRVVVQHLLRQVPDRRDLAASRAAARRPSATTARTISSTRSTIDVDERARRRAGARRRSARRSRRCRRCRCVTESSSQALSMSRLIRAEREAVRVEALGDEGEDLAEDVDRLQHRADGRAERPVRQQRLDQLVRADRDRLVGERVGAGDVGQQRVAGDRADRVADAVEDPVRDQVVDRDVGEEVRDVAHERRARGRDASAAGRRASPRAPSARGRSATTPAARKIVEPEVNARACRSRAAAAASGPWRTRTWPRSTPTCGSIRARTAVSSGRPPPGARDDRCDRPGKPAACGRRRAAGVRERALEAAGRRPAR